MILLSREKIFEIKFIEEFYFTKVIGNRRRMDEKI